jgi:competence protein ComEC
MSPPAPQLRAPLLWLLLPLIAGFIAAWLWAPPAIGLWPLILAAGVAGIAATIFATRQWTHACLSCLVLSTALSGCALLHLRHPQLHGEVTRPPRELTLTLSVTRTFPPSARARTVTGLGVIVAASEFDQDLVGQRVYFSAIRRASVAAKRSGHYTVRGVIEPQPRHVAKQGFDDYLANLGIRHRLTRAQILAERSPPGRFQAFCERTQDRLETILRRGLDDHTAIASIYLAMLLGEKAVLTPEQENAFMRSGTFHIFSISGLHVGVIAAALHHLFQLLRVPRRIAVAPILATLWLYVQVTGAGTPAMRAYLMIAFYLSSKVFWLPGNSLSALAASALATLLLDPLQLFSTGFQMSYTVVAALILMGGSLAERWQARWQPFALKPRPEWRWWHSAIHWSGRQVVGGAAGCWAAFLASIASGIGFFGLFSPGSLPANLIIMPLSSLAIIAGFLSLLVGLAGLLPLSTLFNASAAIILIATDWLLRQCIDLPGVFFPARFRTDWLAPASLVLMTVVLLAGASGRWSTRLGGYWPPVVVLTMVLIFGVKFG